MGGTDGEEEEEEESEVEEDERIMKVLTYSGRHTAKETASYLHEELGGEDAIIYGDLVVGKKDHALAHFLLMGVGCFDDEQPLGPQLEAKQDFFQAAVERTEPPAHKGIDQAALLVAFELFCVKECEAALEDFGPLLRVLWEKDIVAQDVIEAWHQNENALQEFLPKHWSQESAESIRESSRDFLQWLQEGELDG
mmetsp:Transcript_1636/g.4037  ORF Transcript_1636/g.4037 Transcript_1636/m.4037 type:complete len:195 (+) Transcript_1636:72-656(+)